MTIHVEIEHDNLTKKYRMVTEEGLIECRGCKEYLPESKFHSNCKGVHGKHTHCKDCQRFRKLINRLERKKQMATV